MRGAQFGSHNQQFNVESHYHEAASGFAERILVGYPPVADPSNLDRPALRSAVAGPIVVLSGGAGTGKTQLAAAVFAAAVDAGADLAIWASASSRTALVAAYAQADAELRPGRVLVPGTDAEPGAARLISRLRTTKRRWIVVLDDVADAADLHRLLPEGPSGQVVITSRLRGDALAGRGHVVEVEHFTAEEAAEYLRRRLRHRNRAGERMLTESAQLAGDLGHLPLALSVAATYLLDQGLTCAQYRDMLADDALALGDLLGPVPADFGGSPVRAWQLSLDRADGQAPAGVAAPLMRLIAVGDTSGIPEDLLLCAAVGRHLGVTRPVARHALRNLHNLHLITHDPLGAPVAVRTHRLNQRAVLEAVGPAEVEDAVRVMADGLVEVWPAAHQQPALAAALRANAAALAAEHWDALWRDGAHPVLTRAGLSLGEIGLVAAARDHFARMARTATDPADQLAARHHLAHYQGQAGDAPGAARDLEELLAARVALLGAEHPGTLASRNELVYWLVQSGRPAQALAVAEALLADQLRLFGPQAIESLRTRASAAYALGQAGRPREAVAAFERLLADEQRVLDPDDLELLTTRNRLASWRGQSGDAAAAVTAFRSLLADERRVLGDDHPHTLIARHNLAHWLGEAGRIDEAVRDCEQLFTDRLRVLGPDHPHTAATRNNLAHWYGTGGDPARAARALREVLPDRIRVLGPDHPLTLTTRNDLAWWTGAGGDWPRAAAELEQLYADELPLLGADHLDTLATANNLALCRAAAGDRDRAVGELESTVARMSRVLGDEHPHTTAARHNLDLVSRPAPPPGRLAALLRRVRRPAVPEGIFIRGARGIQVGDGNTRVHPVSRSTPSP
jgi:tetratricopeptide (TPR) repeat protein